MEDKYAGKFQINERIINLKHFEIVPARFFSHAQMFIHSTLIFLLERAGLQYCVLRPPWRKRPELKPQ
ncbi:MAG: hypothetical protein VR65_23150 [Desulfobulbaceae bacterium BRH_c16a]|nr:MAG: hypothetical protein VR65_23150 [Desulfobulbaceae bacterium BRH_c16a]